MYSVSPQKATKSLKTEPKITVENNTFLCRLHECKTGQSYARNI